MPAFHALATENDAMRWDFFVRHYEDEAQQRRDPKYVAEYNGKPVDGIWYPRAGALGGCTAHNAMIFVYPHNADWNAAGRPHRRSLVARRAHARVLRAARELPAPARPAVLQQARDEPEPPRLGRMAAHREGRAGAKPSATAQVRKTLARRRSASG